MTTAAEFGIERALVTVQDGARVDYAFELAAMLARSSHRGTNALGVRPEYRSHR